MAAKRKSERAYNDRLFVDLVRQNGPLSKAELTRLSGLSAQSATVIVNRLEEQGLLKPGSAVKGKIGQPSIPYSLNPQGALSIGVKVGRRSLDVALMSFDYEILEKNIYRYDFPRYQVIKDKITTCISDIINNLSQVQADRLLGIGLTIPDDLGAWETAVGAADGEMADWIDADLVSFLGKKFDLPVSALNDASAACLSEIAVGNSEQNESFVYFYVGTFIGGGIAIGNKLYNGQNKLAGSIASIPTSSKPVGMAPQLLEETSLNNLEMKAESIGIDPSIFYDLEELDLSSQKIFEEWLAVAAPQIAFAAVSAQAIVDPDAIVVDGSLSPKLLEQLVNAITRAIQTNYDLRGVEDIKVITGENGISARVIGSGILPLMSEFAVDNF